MTNTSYKPTIVDVFCGGGGFSLGAKQAGFNTGLSIDCDRDLTYSYAENFPKTQLLLADVQNINGQMLRARLGRPVDGLIGGPPCQGFSSIGKRRADDSRRGLLLDYFRLVREVSPKFFVMENVKGLIEEKNRGVLDRGLATVSSRYKILGPLTLNCADFGAATNRKRIFVIGFDPNRMAALDLSMFVGSSKPTTVRDAIADLNAYEAAGVDEFGFDLWKKPRVKVVQSAYAERMISEAGLTTGMGRTIHKRSIAKRFAAVQPGKRDEVGKHFRLDWTGLCPTLRAGTGSDRGSFQSVRPIHPLEPRVITVREAARLQGFPDAFRFHPTVWHSFRMIGNSVSPIIARSILSKIMRCLRASSSIAEAAD